MIAALIPGIISALGIGMCCTMLWTEIIFIPGIVIGVIGIVVISAAYPLCTHITKKQRAKLSPEILRLTDELRK